MRVLPDASIEVRVPIHVSSVFVQQWVRQRAHWLRQRVVQMEQLQHEYPTPRYHEGSRHLYLGKHYYLQLEHASRTQIRLQSDRMVVFTRSHEEDKLRSCLRRWYRQQAEDVFMQRLQMLVTTVPWLDEAPPLAVRRMRSQWGSCSSAGRIGLNLHLIKAPLSCIDYVIAHELCHLREHNHSLHFYRLLDMLMPQWQQRRQQLNGLTPVLLQG